MKFDGENKQLGFTLSTTNYFRDSPKVGPSSSAFPAWAVFVIIGLLVLILLAVVVCICKRRSNPHNEEAKAIYKMVEERQASKNENY